MVMSLSLRGGILMENWYLMRHTVHAIEREFAEHAIFEAPGRAS